MRPIPFGRLMTRVQLLSALRTKWFTRSLVAVCAIGSVVIFHCELMTRGYLDQGDWTHHWHYYDWTRTSLTRYGALPFFMCDASHTPNFVANPQSPIFGPLVWLLNFLSADSYIKLLVILYSSVGFLSVVALLRDLDVELIAALPFAMLFTFNGYFVSHICLGHHWVLGSYLLPAIVLAFRRAVAGSPSALWIASLTNVVSIFEGQHHPFLWNNCFLLVYAIASSVVEYRCWIPIWKCVGVVIASVLLGATKLIPMFSDLAGYAPQARFPGLPIHRLPHALWQKAFTAANEAVPGFPPTHVLTRGLAPFQIGWWEYDFYVGLVGAGILTLGLVSVLGLRRFDRRGLPWLIAGTLFFVICLKIEPKTIEPWSWIRDLPLLNSQRCPSRFFIVALTAFLVAAALGLQGVLEWVRNDGGPGSGRWGSTSLVIASLLVYGDLYQTAMPLERHAVGPPLESLPHRFGESPGPRFASLQEFGPNRIEYTGNTELGPSRIVLPIPDWSCYRSRAAERLPMPGRRQILSE